MAVRLEQKMLERELVKVLQRNMAMYLRKALWRKEFETIDELLRSASEYERLCQEERQQMSCRRQGRINEIDFEQDPDQEEFDRSEQTPWEGYQGTSAVEAMATGPQNNMTVCWNCKDIGHTFSQCKLPKQSTFCYSCGANGVIKANCHKCAGNFQKNVAGAAVTRSSTIAQPQLLRRQRQSRPLQGAGNLYKPSRMH